MKRWNDYYEKMAPPSKTNMGRSSLNSASRSELPRKSVQPNPQTYTGPQKSPRQPSNEQNISMASTAETIFRNGRYSRRDDVGTVSEKVDGGHTNFAWVD